MNLRRTLASVALAAALLVPAQASLAADLLNINTATVEQLAAVPGLTEDIARGIVQYREDMGDFQSLDELTEVEGINNDLLGKLKEYIGIDAIAGAECSC